MDLTSMFAGGGGGYSAASTSGGPFSPTFGAVNIGSQAGASTGGNSVLLYVALAGLAILALFLFRK